ncbi:MAG: hypothetical protein ACRCYQ_05645 [Nocardioides sp.]
MTASHTSVTGHFSYSQFDWLREAIASTDRSDPGFEQVGRVVEVVSAMAQVGVAAKKVQTLMAEAMEGDSGAEFGSATERSNSNLGSNVVKIGKLAGKVAALVSMMLMIKVKVQGMQTTADALTVAAFNSAAMGGPGAAEAAARVSAMGSTLTLAKFLAMTAAIVQAICTILDQLVFTDENETEWSS